jgi:tetratricopeptide (TPR) repeat protein
MSRTFHLSEEYFKRLRKLTLTYTVPLLVIGAPAFMYFGNRRGSGSPTILLPGLGFTAVITGISIYRAVRRQEKLWRTFRVTVDDDAVSRTQDAHTPMTIRAAEIERIKEGPKRGLTIVAQGRGTTLSIPDTLADYDECRALLARWAPIEIARGPLNRAVLLVISLAVMGVFVVFDRTKDPSIVVPLGVAVAAILVFGHVKMQRSPDIDKRTKRWSWVGLLLVLQIAVRVVTALRPGTTAPSKPANHFNAGLSAHRQGDYQEAEYQLLLDIKEVRKRGGDPVALAPALNNLAEAYEGEHKYAEAESFYKQSLATYEKSAGPEDPDTAVVQNNLAGLYVTQRRYADAEPLYQQSRAIMEKSLGMEHPHLASVLDGMAELYWREGRFADAERLYRQAILIWEKSLGPEDVQVALGLSNLALFLEERGRYAEAEPICGRSLAIREKVLGPDDPKVAVTLKRCADILRILNRDCEASTLESRAAAIQSKHAMKGSS